VTQAFRVASVGVVALVACGRRDPPAPDLAPSVAIAEPASAATSAATGVASGTASATTTTTATATAAAGAASADPTTLPQTRDKPSATGPAFDARVRALWDAIVADDPERAMPFFFPLGAYQQVKDIGDAAADWKRRLVAAYAHDIHGLHARLGGDANGNGKAAKLVGLDLPDVRARWVDPGEEYNKIGYWRVFGSRLRYEVDGEARSFEVKSLISWRGEWYVVHLSAIK
jgi:hypothetical protein